MKKMAVSKVAIRLVLLVTVITMTACGGGSGNGNQGIATTAARGDVVATALLATVTAAQAQQMMTSVGITAATSRYDVKAYKITYKTLDPSGTLVNASGLVVVPQKASGVMSPLLSVQHGTIFRTSEAPTSPGSFHFGTGSAIASIGYITVMPDYLGYGDSSGTLHPYLHAQTLASSSIDMLRAARKFLQQNAIAVNGKLFLAGYSEGGYATLAMQKEMETNLSSEFSITASEPGAGPYDMSATTRTMLAAATLPEPSYAAFVVKAYDAIYNNPSEIGNYIQPAYVGAVNSSFDGTKDMATIDAALGGGSIAPGDLFGQSFLTSYAGTGEAKLKAAMASNDIYNWAPKVPTRLFHGTQDTIVPYANAATALATMQADGSTSVEVANCTATPSNHNNCGAPFLLDAKAFFDTKSPGL